MGISMLGMLKKVRQRCSRCWEYSQYRPVRLVLLAACGLAGQGFLNIPHSLGCSIVVARYSRIWENFDIFNRPRNKTCGEPIQPSHSVLVRYRESCDTIRHESTAPLSFAPDLQA